MKQSHDGAHREVSFEVGDCGELRLHQCAMSNIKDHQNSKQAPRNDARRRRKGSLVMHKKRRRILPFVPSEDGARRLKQLASLASALTTSKKEFCNELTYMPNMAPRSSNLARLEVGGIQVLHKEDKESLELCRTMQKRGKFPPLLVVFDSQEGFIVQADGNIKDMTFLAEYSGDVDYLENRANDDCDCLMTLLLSANPSQNLVICPDKRGNHYWKLEYFCGGINNHTPDGKKKKNVKCVRYNIDGESHVLLVACRDIACGDKLYYDYNGYEHAYPTHHFL
ncbi:probable Histone-lysine N-methyltransferase ATXR5 [Miscanthus floridulus]|uniref:probable Histone-lysine N-methyltransferase ATXR5 n=1 Tax=Miscanthus floridulus TaxID=154761 RepID=UPI003457DF37